MAEPATEMDCRHEGSGTADPIAAAEVEKRKVRVRATWNCSVAGEAQELNPKWRVRCHTRTPANCF